MNGDVAVLDVNVAVSVIIVSVGRPTVVIGNVAVVAPAGTVTVGGRVAALFEEDRVTTSPAEPAGVDSVTVPVELNPPNPEDGEADIPVRWASLIVRVADFVEPNAVPVMTACV